jgi:4-aminobutyrate aminotransferase-like enzyme
MPNASIRDKFIDISISQGLHIGGCGDATIRFSKGNANIKFKRIFIFLIRFRPALIFEEKHLKMTLTLLDSALKKL